MNKNDLIKNNNMSVKGCSAIALLILILCFIMSGCGEKEIGTVYGFEHQYLKIGEDTYTKSGNPGVHIAWDKNRKLGTAYFYDYSDPFIIWSIKGYDDYEYLYTTWVYEGAFYKKDAANNEEEQSEK